MKIRFVVLILFLLGVVLGSFTYVNSTSTSVASQSTTERLQIREPTLTTPVWAVFDPKTGAIIAGNETATERPIASVTKLVTAAISVENNTKDETFVIQDIDLLPEGRSGKLEIGQETTAYRLLFPLLLESSNDAGEAIKNHATYSYDDTLRRFLDDRDMTRTSIFDGSGLDVRNTSTATDLAKLFAHIQKKHPHILDITQLHTYIDDHTGYRNNNPAHELTGFTGGKHGYLPEAGYTFVGSFEVHDTQEVGFVLLGSQALEEDLKALIAAVEYIQE